MHQCHSPPYVIIGKSHVKLVLSFEQVVLVQALSSASNILVDELQKLSQAIDQPIDIKDVASSESFGFTLKPDLDVYHAEVLGQVSSKLHNVSEVV